MEEYIENLQTDIEKSIGFIGSVKDIMLRSGKPAMKAQEASKSWTRGDRSTQFRHMKSQLVESTITHWKLAFMATIKDQLANFKLGKVKHSPDMNPEVDQEAEIVARIKEKIDKLRQK